ncbi:RCC1 domain-containing protein [Pyxidicoccus fallax]|uniref:RCC1 domain-containing protein n=1 Tax=Pyxidicoccus fallax TaxID=394095 RepID=UPI0031B62E21
MWAWGYGWDGQLGTGTPGNSSTPSPMRSLPCRSCWTERALGAGVLFRCPRMTPRT